MLLRRARVNEVGFEIVNTDLESRFRLRGVLMEAVERAPEVKNSEWGGERSPKNVICTVPRLIPQAFGLNAH